MFCNPYDSTLLGVHLVNKRDTLMKIIPEKKLYTKGIIVDGFHLNESIFMTLLHKVWLLRFDICIEFLLS